MTLNAAIVCPDKIEARGIDNVCARRVCDMLAPGPVAPFTPNIPLGHGFRFDVVIHRMATVAQRARRALEIVGRIQKRPPVRSVFYEIGPPDLVRDIPLRWQDKVVIANFLEISLLPSASIHERDFVPGERNQRIVLRKVRQNSVGMLFGVADDVRHTSRRPAVINLFMTSPATERPDEGWRGRLRKSSNARQEDCRNNLVEVHGCSHSSVHGDPEIGLKFSDFEQTKFCSASQRPFRHFR